MQTTVHLLANSHLDPVWLWEWTEGAVEALALARAAVGICEQEPAFVFNRGDARFYMWIEELDPELFQRIRRLVAAGQWQIMGGWFLQPDCNLPNGEAMIRQIQLGRRYFRDRFGVTPRTAVNLDPFGHSRGLVQILVGCRYDSYLYCRPQTPPAGVGDDGFRWVGYDGSVVTALLAAAHYNSPPGGAAAKVEEWLARLAGRGCILIPWGVGNHGGGPSLRDCRDLAALARRRSDLDIRHSSVQACFADLRRRRPSLPEHRGDLNPWAVGCYTSMSRVKQAYRRLESSLLALEKLLAPLAVQGGCSWPGEELEQAWQDLLFCQFHDCLTGTSIRSVEEHLHRLLGRGREKVDELRFRALQRLADQAPPARPGHYPIFVYNHHPHPVHTTLAIELQEPWPNESGLPLVPRLRGQGRTLPVQLEKARMNINEDHRHLVVFQARLRPGRLERFDFHFARVDRRRPREAGGTEQTIPLVGSRAEAVVHRRQGRLVGFRVGGRELIAPGGCRLLVMADDQDPWAMRVDRFRRLVGTFKAPSARRCAEVAGLGPGSLAPVRVVEDGPVRRVVEAILVHNRSYAVVRYKLSRREAALEIEILLQWQEKDRFLKLALPTPLASPRLVCQSMFGREEPPADGRETLCHQWAALAGREGVLACINDGVYGLDARDGELRISLLRSPAPAGHPKGEDLPIVPGDRYTPRLDQGEHRFRFRLVGGAPGLLDRVDRLAQEFNEPPRPFYLHPRGGGSGEALGPVLADPSVLLVACRRPPGSRELVLRLFEPTGRRRSTRVELPWAGAGTRVDLEPFQLVTLRWNGRRWRRGDLLD